ncbi:glycosyltransferase family 4 protein [Spirosoma rigui]|uniref:glycosyltransferase family 4 protein n=1 Tax=Spirosoma rigui TaxID=564064 RepID=UPI0009AFE567|nr:glycosyltransferase [Spirosoma rigui]
MRILIVHNLLWAHYKASVFQALKRAIDKQAGITLNVLQIARNERSRAGLEAGSHIAAPVYDYPYELLFDRFLEDVSLRDRTRMLLRHVRAFRPDVINLTGYYDPAQLAVLAWANANGVPVIMQNESTAVDHQRGGWKEQFKRLVFGRCAGFFCFGEQSARYLTELGVPASKVLLRKNAVDNKALRQAYDKALPTRNQQQQALGLKPNNFIFVGRLIAFKNLPMLLACFAEARQQVPEAHDWGVVLLGDGPEQPLLEQLIKTLNLTDSVQLLPGRPWFTVPDILALANVLVLPSTSEPWGLVVNEAMACGLPVLVSSRCGCVPDLVHDGQNGYVFDPAQPGELTRHLVQFMQNSVPVESLSKAAGQSVAAYSPEAVAEEMLAGFIKVTK